jgi:hypothetical protein
VADRDESGTSMCATGQTSWHRGGADPRSLLIDFFFAAPTRAHRARKLRQSCIFASIVEVAPLPQCQRAYDCSFATIHACLRLVQPIRLQEIAALLPYTRGCNCDALLRRERRHVAASRACLVRSLIKLPPLLLDRSLLKLSPPPPQSGLSALTE